MKCISIFKCNPQIEVIDKSHCKLEDVPNFQNYSRSLEELCLDSNNLYVLNENVFKLTKLRRLSFRDNAIQVIPTDIIKLRKLVELDCAKNPIQEIPEQIKFLRGLQICTFIQSRDLQRLPPGFTQLKNLTSLTILECGLQALPDDIGLLKNLEHLDLRNNQLDSLPASITSLENLKKLDIGINYITNLPEDIGRLSNLEYLSADMNELETVPSDIGRLANLECLDLNEQIPGLKYLPDEIGGLVSLTHFDISKNLLESIPDGIGNLKKLVVFKADENYLTELNPNIGGCTSQQELFLSSNQITTLPSSIGDLTDLRTLNVDNNRLKDLTPKIGNIKHLSILTLRDNQLTLLPSEIGRLEMIRVLDVSGNRIEYLPMSITSLNLRALWLSKNQAQPLPKLQIDVLEDGTKVLTCYLLPQQSGENEGFNQNNATSTVPENFESNRPAAVSFDVAAVDDVDSDSDANFIRHDTPHPSQLRARHQKLFDRKEKTELKGHDNASFTMADTNIHQTTHDRDGYGLPDSNTLQTYQHPIEYESNGLPEVLPTQIQQVNSKSLFSNTLSNNFLVQDENGDYGQKSKYFYENGVGKQHKDTLQHLNKFEQFGNKYHVESNMDETDFQTLDILVRRSKNHKPGLGLSIAGGKDTPPYKGNDEGIFVSKVTRGGPAEAAGVKVGDKILAVNSNIFHDGITHQKAVDIFRKLKPDCAEFTIRVLRDPNDEPPEDDKPDDDYSIQADSIVTNNSKSIEKTSNGSNFTRTYTIPAASETITPGTINNLRHYLMKEPEKVKSTASTLPPGMSLTDNSINKNIIYTTLVKDYKRELGLVLENRAEEGESRSNWSNIIISHIKPNSIASRDGKLQVNDRLLSINGADVTGIDLDRIILMLEGTERFIRIVVSRGEGDDPIGAALRNMPVRPPLGSWFSSTSNMSHRPSLIESYQRPTFGSVSSLQKQSQLLGNKPPKPPKPTHLVSKDSDSPSPAAQSFEDNPIARPRARGPGVTNNQSTQISDVEKRAAWRRERLKSIEDDVEMAKLIAEAHRRRLEEK